jgi:hypothetical protein
MRKRPLEHPNVSSDLRHWEGVADPGYLLREIKELKAIAGASGLGSGLTTSS